MLENIDKDELYQLIAENLSVELEKNYVSFGNGSVSIKVKLLWDGHFVSSDYVEIIEGE